MHCVDKVGRLAVGDLTCKDGHKHKVNPFPGGVGLTEKLRKLAKHFSAAPTDCNNYKKFPSMTEKQLWDKDVEIGKEEFDAVFENWTNFPRKWKKLHPKELHDVKKVDPVEHLMNLDAKVWLAAAETINKKNGCFGLLPDMWKCLPCQLGALWSQSFVERMNSAGNLLVTKDKMNLGDDLIEKLVVLRMNKEFMKFMRTERPSLIVNQLKPSKN